MNQKFSIIKPQFDHHFNEAYYFVFEKIKKKDSVSQESNLAK